MDLRDEEKLLNYIQSALNIYHGQGSMEWFFSFGTLLYFIRDKKIGVPMWGDYDVSLLAENSDASKIMLSMENHGFELGNKIIDDITGEPYQLVYYHRSDPLSQRGVDIYFWTFHNGYYWHTFDSKMENPSNGIPSEYLFKGTEADAFKGDLYLYTWLDNIRKVPFPFKYGTLLDVWYPGWYIPDKRFGQSKAHKTITVKSCGNLQGDLV